MSERFVLAVGQDEVEKYFFVETDAGFNIEADYNISVGAVHPLVFTEDGKRCIKRSKWGLIPADAEEEREGKEHSLVPIEDVDEDQWYAECVEKRRALIPASGFYKWKTTENTSTPFYVRMLSNDIMALGGIYSRWKSKRGLDIYSFAILTQQASALVEPVDSRMPLIVSRDSFEMWLDPQTEVNAALDKAQRSPAGLTEMIVNRVGEEVNDITNSGSALIQPIPK